MTGASSPSKAFIRRILTVGSFSVISLILALGIAGDFTWEGPWILTLSSALVSLTGLKIIPKATIAERGSTKTNVEAWDRWITSSAGILYFVFFVMAGLDHRFDWSPKIDLRFRILAWIIFMAGNALVLWAMKVNAFFSDKVRLQTDRGQTVCDQGPYRFIRHPGYLGIISYYLMMPMVIGSWISMIPVLLTAILMVIRTIKEDRLLKEKLMGYQDYALRVTSRLVPHLW